MRKQLSKSYIERFSRQIILKNVGILGQKKILSSKVLIVGAGGLGCPAAEFLTRAGVGTIGIVDNDKVALSNLHRQSLYSSSEVGRSKVSVVKKKLNLINQNIKIKPYKLRLNKTNIKRIAKNYDYIIDGSDNFKTKFLLNDYCLKNRKNLVSGAISKFDGHIFTFNFKNKKIPCLKCFYQENKISDDLLNCETEGILGTVASTVGTLQANEVLKKILNLNGNIDGFILIVDMLNLNFRKAKIKKRKGCLCK
jgi:adenylyltransferase/sulfurtransferase